MNVFLWIVAAALAGAFLAVGSMKLGQSKEKLAESGNGWVEDFAPGTVKAIGALEVLAALALILPALLDISPGVVPLAALGLVLLMIGAAITHARRQEWPMIGVNLVLAVLASVVAWGRFGPYSFGS
ncbi:MAG: DoxX family protein [Actinomycetota bacterium]|nr:DoxX family protein [Actinomycetota bacterium]